MYFTNFSLVFENIFWYEDCCILIPISPTCVPKVHSLRLSVAYMRPDKHLSFPLMSQICVKYASQILRFLSKPKRETGVIVSGQDEGNSPALVQIMVWRPKGTNDDLVYYHRYASLGLDRLGRNRKNKVPLATGSNGCCYKGNRLQTSTKGWRVCWKLFSRVMSSCPMHILEITLLELLVHFCERYIIIQYLGSCRYFKMLAKCFSCKFKPWLMSAPSMIFWCVISAVLIWTEQMYPPTTFCSSSRYIMNVLFHPVGKNIGATFMRFSIRCYSILHGSD